MVKSAPRLGALLSIVAMPLVSATLLAADAAPPLTWKFKGIRETGMGLRGIYTLTNVSKRDIDDVILYLTLKDGNGESLTSTAITDATPGVVWLKAGQSLEEGVPLNGSFHKAAKKLLETRPNDGKLVIEVKQITYTPQ